MRNNKEIKVIQECLKGEEVAFKALYDMYKGYVYTICVRYGISDIEVKDCMQTIFMELFRSLTKYNSNISKFKTWLTSVTINQILAHKRKLNINYEMLDADDMNLIEADFFIPLESQMDEKIMHDILNRMPSKYSPVFNLFIIDGYSHTEISEMLNITEGASRIILHRARIWAMKELKPIFGESINEYKKIRIQNK